MQHENVNLFNFYKLYFLYFDLFAVVVINLLNRSFQGFYAGVAVDTPDRLIPKFTSRYCQSTIGIAVVLPVLSVLA